jgi:uncharacterized membrane protein YfcA
VELQFTLLAIIVLFSYLIGTTTGFGSSIIALTLSVHLYPMEFLIPVVIPLNIGISAYLVLRHYAGINGRTLFLRIIPPVAVGLPVGLIIFHIADTEKMKWAFGLFVLSVSLFELYRTIRSDEESAPRPLTKKRGLVWLLGGGITQGLWVSGGPMVAYWAARSIPSKREFRSTLACLFLILNGILLLAHTLGGRINLETGRTSVVLLPFVAVGVALGEWLYARLQEKTFRIVVFTVLVFAGASIVLRS